MGETVLGNRYEIIKKIGDGGMAFVYEARDKLLNRTVAIKVLRPEFVDDDEFLTKFKREAEAVASLSHPNIVNVYDVGEDGKVHYIVMELIEGQNLKDIIKNEGTLDEYTALDITKQIAKALGAAHKKGIIHRDIKPHNILISNEGRIVKVADFGIAKAVSSSTMTSTGSVIGSVHYFSPEQAKGKFVGNTTDLYSLGIVLYEMIIGRVPFRGDSPISIALQHINDEIEFTQEEKISIPQSVRNIIKKLTSKSSADRYQGADELIEDIEYIEKNIDLDFIKEYDNYATQKIDESELNKALKMGNTNPDIRYDKDDLIEDDEEEIVPKKSNKSNKRSKKDKKTENPKSKKRWKIAAVILSLILIVQIIFIGKIALGFKGNKVEEGTTPNLINMQLDEAQAVANKLDVEIKIRIEEYSDKFEKDHIMSQAPNAGTPISKGDTITVVISKGQNQAS
ncbi:MAG: Stk1 family PASTA domain-containing Ser/Thr kinase, partial [Peptostreptococcaceae bacterium]